MTFRGRMVGAVTAVTVVTLGGAFMAIYFAVNRSQERQLDAALLGEALEEAREVAALGGTQLAISDRPGPAANDVGPLTKYGAIYDAGGTVLAATPTFRAEPPPLATLPRSPGHCFDLNLDSSLRREDLRGVLVAVPSRAGVRLLLAAPRTDLDGDAAFLRGAMLLVFAVAVAWAVAVANWVVRRLTRDHQTIAAVARRVAGGDLGARIELLSSDREVVQLARDLNEMIERLGMLLASQNQFIAHAAHELRSPLTTLYGELSLALRRSRDIDSYRQSIEEALGSARRLKTLAEDLLTLARLGAPQDEPKEEVRVSAVIEAAARSVAAEAAERSVAVRVDGACHVISARALELERLFRNLIENAIRYSPRGGTVRAGLREEAGGVAVMIADEGPGIPVEDRERIFEPFYRGPRAQASDLPGAGLGLAIARQIARSHGGDVHLGLDYGLGATFIVRLPG